MGKPQRKEYNSAVFDESSAHPDPFRQFEAWFNAAINAGLTEPNTMMLATAGEGGTPALRAVLFKELDTEGFVFYTNYLSSKARQIEQNNNVAAAFVWNELERQIRFEGRANRISRERSASYFQSRPRGAQLAAIASPQSSVLKSRQELETRFREVQSQFSGKQPECPADWGGYVIVPERFEFWQGRENRLHDRLEYIKQGSGWAIRRLAP